MKKRSFIISFMLIVLLLASLMGVTTKDIVNKVNLGLDLQGGFEVLYQVEPLEKGDKIDDTAVKSAAKTLESRVNVLGVSEPVIQVEEGNRIRVQLAGVEDQNEARELLSTQAHLTIRDVNDKALLTGKDLVEGGASQSFDENGNPMVSLKLKDSNKFGEVTKEISEKTPPENMMVIWMDFKEGEDSFMEESQKEDPKYVSAANVSEPIQSSDVMISGGFEGEEGLMRAKNIAALLNSGSLPVELDEIYSTSVGAQFGEQALEKTVIAGALGVLAVFIFMLIFYRIPGLIAVITLSTYIYLTLVAFNLIGGVLTLPGIAALILGVGMAVDANIIMYERIKDEIRIGRSVKQAYKKGSAQSLWTIVDANITTIIAALVLFFFGTSSVKGFATMLLISILLSFVTSVFLTRLLLSLLVKSNYLNKKFKFFGVRPSMRHELSEGKVIHDLTTAWDRYDFVKHMKKFFTLSGLIILAGLIILTVFKLNLGIDFTSGTRIDVASDETIKTEHIEKSLNDLKIDDGDVTLSQDKTRATIQVKDDLDQEKISEVKDKFNKAYGQEPNVSTVSPVIGKELVKNAILSLLIASIGIIIYATIRFEWRMALSSVIALLHDAFIIIAMFSILRLEVDITFIAAVLTIIGYSINDTIVTFDRVRENLRKFKVIKSSEEIDLIVNRSLRQTLTRSINTVVTVIFVVVLLVFFGADSIFNFSVALFIGLISGVYSSVFIAVQLWALLKKQQLKKSEGQLVVYEEKSKDDEKILV